jgi:two-component system NtrC family sensor kinase
MPERTVAELEALLAAERGRVAALERERAATAEVLRIIGESSADLDGVLHAIAERLGQLTNAAGARVQRVFGDREKTVAAWGAAADVLGAGGMTREQWLVRPGMEIQPGTPVGRAILERRTVHVSDLAAALDDFAAAGPYQRRFGVRSALAAPMLRGGRAVGSVSVYRTEVRPFSEDEIELIGAFADQAVIAIENARLFSELQERLEEQTATSEVLRAIAGAPGDLAGVLDMVLRNAMRLCASDVGAIFRRDGDEYRGAGRRAHQVADPRQPGVGDRAGGAGAAPGPDRRHPRRRGVPAPLPRRLGDADDAVHPAVARR